MIDDPNKCALCQRSFLDRYGMEQLHFYRIQRPWALTRLGAESTSICIDCIEKFGRFETGKLHLALGSRTPD